MARRFLFGVVGILFISFAFFISLNFTFADEATDPLSVQIRLRVEAPDKTLFDSDITVNPCIATSTQASSTSAFCAIEQTDLGASWTWYDFGPMLQKLEEYNGDFTNYWSWFSDKPTGSIELGQTGLDLHTLTQDEHLLLTFGVNPLKLNISSTTIESGATTTISALGFGYDASWNTVWNPIENFSLDIASTTFNVASSTYEFSTTTLGTYAIRATKNSFAPSEYYLITVKEKASSTNPIPSPTPTPTPPPNTGGGTTPKPAATFDIQKALAFLSSQQKPDGSFGADLYTDWAAIALSGNSGAAKENIKNYFINSTFSGNSATDYERHAMALMSLGLNPYTTNNINYIKKITDYFDGNQIGDTELWNDDIFALFPLLKSGYTSDDEIIKKTAAFIISKQSSNGSFGSIDITAAAIQALSQVQNLPNANSAIASAKNFLKSAQSNAGFGTSFATSWTIQAISALGESQSSWIQNNKIPDNYIASFQQTDGGVEPASVSDDSRIWATAYAVPAAQNRTWFSLMSSFSKPSNSDSSNPLQDQNTNNQTATSTNQTASSTSPQATTQNISTSTIPITPHLSGTPLKLSGDAELAKIPEFPDLASTSSSQSTSTPLSNQLASAGAVPTENHTLVYILSVAGIIILGYLGFRLIRN